VHGSIRFNEPAQRLHVSKVCIITVAPPMRHRNLSIVFVFVVTIVASMMYQYYHHYHATHFRAVHHLNYSLRTAHRIARMIGDNDTFINTINVNPLTPDAISFLSTCTTNSQRYNRESPYRWAHLPQGFHDDESYDHEVDDARCGMRRRDAPNGEHHHFNESWYYTLIVWTILKRSLT
jgi:hypothetical protein